MTITDQDTALEQPSDAEVLAPIGADYTSNRAFADFPISRELLAGIHGLGYVTATAVQAATIEPALAGRDMLVRAKTGTGKTTAFGVPMIERVAAGARAPRALTLAPTRELAQQIAEEVAGLASHKDVSIVTLVGGVRMEPQIEALEAGAEIIIGTPGRVLDHIKRGHLDPSGVEIVCLDEADEMLSMGFFEDVTKILDKCGDKPQVLLFSATISPDTQRLAARYLHDPEELVLSTDTDHVDGIEHVLYETQPGMHKVRSLLYLLDLENPSSAIIFCNTREDAATVATFLDRQGLDAQLLSGELPQARRTKVMAKVKAGEIRFLAATDVAARGIDISDLSHVINYSLPQDPAVYMHRVGRTGRIGKKGVAISLVGGTDLSTRRMLESVHKVDFNVRIFPDAETVVQQRVERQAEQIKAAMSTMVFEAYLPTVRALKDRADGDVLLAAALRAFFQWDRTRRVQMSGLEDLDAVRAEQRREKSEREGGRGSDRDSRGSRSADRGGRGERSDRGGRSDERGGRSGDRDDRKRGRSERRPAAEVSTDDLDALLVEADGDTAATVAAADAKKKRRRRKKSSDGDGEGETTVTTPVAIDDLDALLSEG